MDEKVLFQLELLKCHFNNVQLIVQGVSEIRLQEEARLSESEIVEKEKKLLQLLGIILDDEITNHCIKVESIFVDCIKNMRLERRCETFLSKDFFTEVDGYVMTSLKESILLKQKDQVLDLMLDFVVLEVMKNQRESGGEFKVGGSGIT